MNLSPPQRHFVLRDRKLEAALDDVVTWVPRWMFFLFTGNYGGRFERPFEGTRRGDAILLRSKARTGWFPWTMVHLELQERAPQGDAPTEVVGRARAPVQALGMALLAGLAVGFVMGFPGTSPAASLIMVATLGLYWALMRTKKRRELAQMSEELRSVLEQKAGMASPAS